MTFEAFHNITLGELLSIQAKRYPNQVFLHHEDKRWTYAETELQASALAAGLHELGLQTGDRLAVVLPDTPAFVITVFAAAKAGLIIVPVNARRDESALLSRFTKTRPRGIVTFSDPNQFSGRDHVAEAVSLQKDLPDLQYVISVSLKKNRKSDGVLAWESLLKETSALPAQTTKPSDPAAIIHTLGSLGEPRGAILVHSALAHNAASMASTLGYTSEDVFISTAPFSNTFGLTATMLACAIAGGTLICQNRYHVGETLKNIAQKKVTVHNGTPTMFAMELNHPDFSAEACASLRTGIMSGAPCPPELVKRVREEMGFHLILAYGLTEAAPGVTMTHPDDGPITAVETVGRPMEGVEVKVIGTDGAALPDCEEGELCVRGYNVMSGYWENPEATSQALDKDGWLHTGDLATIDPDGPVRIVGRKSEIIIRGGFKIHPASVEIALRSHPGVKEAAVVGIPDLIYGELVCACLVKRPGAKFNADDIIAYAKEHCPTAIPDRVIFFEALPRRGGAAIRKDYLRERVRIHGHAWKFGRNIDTDAIIPARRCNTSDPRELALYCMEDADAKFVSKMHRGDLIVADSNFGCGSSREVAPLTIKAAGVSVVVAKSFARIFFRNAINIGLPILECPQAVDGISEGDEVEVEPAAGVIRNLTTGKEYHAAPFPDFLQRIIDVGGLLAYAEERLNNIAARNEAAS